MGTKIWGAQTAGSSNLSFWLNPGANSSMKADTPFSAATENGYIDAVYVYARTQNGSAATAKNAIYVGNTLEKETPLYTLSGSMGWQGQIFGSNGYLYVTAGSQLIGAVWTNTNGLEIYAVNNGGVFEYNQSAVGFPNPWTGTQKTSWGGLGWYCTYFPVATVTGIPATPVAPGQSFTVTGQSFSSGINSVTVNGVACTNVTYISDTQLTATLAPGTSSGHVTVNTNAGSGTSSGTLIVSSAYLIRSGVAREAQGIYLFRSGNPSQAQGVLRFLNGQWVNAQ